nr:hypothetical protein [Tanacetum cinerariifolium]GFA25490.1 hypothetical protein [Tanacetum cinerariifolium]
IETTDEGIKILATVDGKPRTISESSIRRNIKLRDEAGISSLPDAELFENLTLMGVNSHSFSGRTVPLFPSMLVTMGEGSETPTEPHHIPTPEAAPSPQHELSSSSLPPVTTATIPTVIPTETPPLRQYTMRAKISQSLSVLTVADEPASPLEDDSQGEACPTVSSFKAEHDRENIIKTSTLTSDSTPRVTSLAADEGNATIKGRSLEIGEEAGIERSMDKGSNNTEEIVNVLTSLLKLLIIGSTTLEKQCNLHSSGISFLLAVGTFFTGSKNFFWQWELHNWQWECLVQFIPNNPPLNLML